MDNDDIENQTDHSDNGTDTSLETVYFTEPQTVTFNPFITNIDVLSITNEKTLDNKLLDGYEYESESESSSSVDYEIENCCLDCRNYYLNFDCKNIDTCQVIFLCFSIIFIILISVFIVYFMFLLISYLIN
jgi:hypothetical protein